MTIVDRVVFVHGSGRAGRDAWPAQRGARLARECVYLVRPGYADEEDPVSTDFAVESRRVLEACGEGAHVVAASYGALAALGAAELSPELVHSLVLIEPVAFSLGRGLPAVEAHIRALSSVIESAAAFGPADYLVRYFTALGAVDPVRPTNPRALRIAERMRLQRAPWLAEFDPATFRAVPTLVVTGNWNPEYEALAARLQELGARHEHLEGHGHSAHEAPGFNALVGNFWEGLGLDRLQLAADRAYDRVERRAGGVPLYR